MELTPAEFPWEYTPWFCREYISTLHMSNRSTLYCRKCFLYPSPSFSHPSLAVRRPWQLATGRHFFKVKTLTFTNRGGPWPRLLLTICISPYRKDAFMPQIAQEADQMGSSFPPPHHTPFSSSFVKSGGNWQRKSDDTGANFFLTQTPDDEKHSSSGWETKQNMKLSSFYKYQPSTERKKLPNISKICNYGCNIWFTIIID